MLRNRTPRRPPEVSLRNPGAASGTGDDEEGRKTLLYGILGLIWFVLLITLGVISIRKGHWVMFIIGIFLPLFWFIGALLPRKVR